MIGKVFFDTNVIVDIFLHRDGENDVMEIIRILNSDKWHHMYISYLTVANLAYILRKKGLAYVQNTLKRTLSCFNVLSSNDIQIQDAIKGDSPDFEDSLQIACAENNGCDLIITRNPSHFRSFTEIPVLTPSDFLSHCS